MYSIQSGLTMTQLLDLQFFKSLPDDQGQGKDQQKVVGNGNIVATSIGSGFLFVGDTNHNVTKIDHKREAQSVPVDLQEISYLRASQKDQRVLVAGPDGNGFGVCVIEGSTFENSVGDYSLRIVPYRATDSVTEPAQVCCASPSLNYFAFIAANNEVYVFSAEDKKNAKPVTKPLDCKVHNMFVTDAGWVYLASTERVSAFAVSNPKQTVSVDSSGCRPNFAFMNNEDNLCVLRDGKILTCYRNEGGSFRKTTFELPSDDKEPEKVGFAGNYLYVVYPFQIQNAVQKIKLIDMKHKLQTLTENLTKHVQFVELQWGALLILLEDNTMLIRTEIDDKSKIDKLCNCTQFEKAIEMANDLHLPPEVAANIHKLQGDQFYGAQKFDKAIEEYILTLGFTEPSHVIQKFVEPHHANNLMKYLLQLQEKKLATKQHTTLLFNCYTKIRADGLLESAVKKFVAEANDADTSFDVKTAVDVLKRNGYKGYAEDLAKAYGQHNLYIQLLYETKNYADILNYMATLPGNLVRDNLIEYGSEIMDNFPEGRDKLIEFAVRCCTEGIPGAKGNEKIVIDTHQLAMIFMNNDDLHFDFLYRVYTSDKRTQKMTPSNWNVLIEMALRSKSDKLMELLKAEDAEYTNEQVLVYLTAFDHTEGKMLIYEKMGLYAPILQEADPEKCLEICQKHGKDDRTLWSDALVKLSRADCDPAVLSRFLEEVQKEDALPFLTILKVMRGAGKHKFSTLLPIVQATFKKEQDLLHEAEHRIEECNRRVTENKAVIHALSTQNYVINQKTCEMCKKPIDSESNHFMCGHSYHKGCLGDAQQFCRLCKDKFVRTLAEKQKRIENATKQDSIEASGDGFQFLLDQIGQSLFSSGVDLMSTKQNDEEKNETRRLLDQMNG